VIITKDKNGKEICIDPDFVTDQKPYQVMMEWEKPYMQKLVDKLNPKGDVLEIGFGLGYSATRISSYPIDSYTVIEKDTSVIENIKKWGEDKNFPINIIEGMWQEKINDLGIFDSILFDDSPCIEYPDPDNIRFYDFFYRIMLSHVRKGSRMSWYVDSPGFFFCPPYVSYDISSEKMFIDPTAEYVTDSGDEMFFPVVTFHQPSDQIDTAVFLSQNLKVIGMDGFLKNPNFEYKKKFYQETAFALPTMFFS
jgi:hypothetical protein